MRYQYGGNITVIAPPGIEVRAQLGKMTPDGPVIHIPTYQMEAPAELLKADGWQIPDLEQGNEVHQVTVESTVYEKVGAQIVAALLDEEDQPVGREMPKGKRPHCKNCGSFTHPAERCPREGTAIV